MPGPKHAKSRSFLSRDLFRDVATFAELERRITNLPSNQDRGDAFEVFAEAYIATQTTCQAAEVWPFDCIPFELRQKHALDTFRDMGVDGVYETTLGELNAYQAKFRTGRTSLKWEELSTFMGLTDQVRERVVFTNSEDLPPLMADRTGFFCIRGSDLDRLERPDFEAILGWLEAGRLVYERKNPREHQAEAIAAITAALQGTDRASTVMACGTGKTLVALWVAETLGVDTILVLVPSLALVRQTLHEWAKETRWEGLTFLCVCSDPSVNKADDDVVVRQADLDFPVTTDAASVRAFLEAHTGVRVVFSTYQSAEVVARGMPETFRFDIGIFDEAHKTAGREGTRFSFALRDENLRIGKRLFMTATPRHYDIRKKDKEGEARLVYSMDAKDSYGARAFTLPFGEAAQRGIICGYKVIISVATTEMVDSERRRRGEVIVEGDVVKAQQVANQIALQKAVEQYGIRKVFTFHSSVKSAKSFVAEGGEGIGVHLPSFAKFHVNGTMPTSIRDGFMKEFRDADRAIITNARCLTEGVDVPAVDMVAFLSPRKSKVDIVQATGRAMRKSDETGKTHGYVLVPLYLEQHENETIEEALKRTDFGDIWNVLQAMQEQDDELAEIIRELREQRGRARGFDDSRLRERITVLGPAVLLAELREGITTALVERLGATWDERFGELASYTSQFGNCHVPAKYEANPMLGIWASHQRRYFKTGTLRKDRQDRLEKLGFRWEPLEATWDEMFDALKTYKVRHGNCNIPRRFAENPTLGQWTGDQRKRYQKGKLSAERIKRLEEIGFVLDPLAAAWREMVAELVKYKRAHGHCMVPALYEDNRKLGNWVSSVRRSRNLSSERIKELSDIGFAWDPLDEDWERMFRALVALRDKHGHCKASRSDEPELAIWVGRMRTYRKQQKLSEERERRLTEIGFLWSPFEKSWQEMFYSLKRYRDEHGHCLVPQSYVKNKLLGHWVANQRNNFRTGALDAERIKLLEDIGFSWNKLDATWERRFADLVQFKVERGHVNVPKRFPENPKLSNWITVQRRQYKSGSLGQERVQRLNELGFDWSVLGAAWESMFNELTEFHRLHGHCNVPNRWRENGALGTWVSTQRRAKLKGSLDEERGRRLNDLGFEWDR